MSAKIQVLIDKLQHQIKERGGILRDLEAKPILYSRKSSRLYIVLIDNSIKVIDYYIEYRLDLKSVTHIVGIFSHVSSTTCYFIDRCFEGICD